MQLSAFASALMGMLIHNNSTSPQELTFARCLLELSLASNAPTTLKTHALRLLPARLAIPLPQLALTPYVPVPGTNGEEWDRLEPASALDALVEMVLAGEYGGVDGDAGPGSSARRKDKLELRAAAAGVFEVRCSRCVPSVVLSPWRIELCQYGRRQDGYRAGHATSRG